jgi:diketogulonate reductase-like aldo/keto reductase
MIRIAACAGSSFAIPFHTMAIPILSLQKRTIPSSGEKIPAVGLGTWRTFDAGNDNERRTTLKGVMKTLVHDGASVIDSSPMYGSSEKVVGDLSETLQARSSLFLATKVWTNGKQSGIEQMDESFRKMKTKVMDLMQVHNLVDVKTHLKTLYDWKAQGKIRYVGITHYLPSAYEDMARLIQNEHLDFLQCCYNIRVTDAEKHLLPLAKEKGVAVLINRPFNEGTLLDSVAGKKLPPWSNEIGVKSWAQFFLKYILSNQDVTCVIPGTSNPLHLAENIQAGDGRFPDDKERKKMMDYFKNL